jgi:hypothetical protein
MMLRLLLKALLIEVRKMNAIKKCDICGKMVDRSDCTIGHGTMTILLPSADGTFDQKERIFFCEACGGKLLEAKHEIESHKEVA